MHRAVVLRFSLPVWLALLGVPVTSAQEVPAPAVAPESLGRQGRDYVDREYSWDTIDAKMEDLFARTATIEGP